MLSTSVFLCLLVRVNFFIIGIVMIKPGEKNNICDVEGILVGNACDNKDVTGVTVVLPSKRVVAGVDVRGGAPGTREVELLKPENFVQEIDAIVLSGGSVFGLEAASAVTNWLSYNNKGIDFYSLLDDRDSLETITASAEFTWIHIMNSFRGFSNSLKST